MIFEGSEKKVEIVVSDIDLRFLGQQFWEEVVSKSKATILSVISNEYLDAYLLSESSLFVWKDRFTMITCGTTTLCRAVDYILEKLGKEKVELLVFQRKNEHFAHLQNTTFYEDVERLRTKVKGTSLRFGPKHEHHNFLFHLDKAYTPQETDSTSELLMYDIQEPAKKILIEPNNTKEKIREFFDFKTTLPEFQIDDFAFDPFGYSMNAIKGDSYCTIHVTPQESSSYVSFETNLPLGPQVQNIFIGLIEKIKPRSFDTVSFNCDMKNFMPTRYNRKTVASESLAIGYEVTFCHYFMEVDEIESPYRF